MKNKIKSNKIKSNQIKYSDVPIEAKVVNDFLPRPEELVLKERKTRVTLTLTQKSLDFFKQAAKKHKAPYQAMIRRLLFFMINQRSR